jgi:hypothetical protein
MSQSSQGNVLAAVDSVRSLQEIYRGRPHLKSEVMIGNILVRSIRQRMNPPLTPLKNQAQWKMMTYIRISTL